MVGQTFIKVGDFHAQANLCRLFPSLLFLMEKKGKVIRDMMVLSRSHGLGNCYVGCLPQQHMMKKTKCQASVRSQACLWHGVELEDMLLNFLQSKLQGYFL